MTVNEVAEKYKKAFRDSFDLSVVTGTIGNYECLYVYMDGFVDKETLSKTVIEPLKSSSEFDLDGIRRNTFCPVEIKEEDDIESTIEVISNGETVLFVEGRYYSIPLIKYERRSIAEPPTSSVIKGPRAGFVEDITINTTLLRRRLKTPDLCIRKFEVGKYTKTIVAVCYLTSVADPKIAETVESRIKRIDIDGIIDSSYIAMLIEDNHSSIFSQTASQEKPDIAVAKLLEGRVAILVDGSPMVLTVPHLLLENFQDSDDYFKRKQRVSFVRILRLLGLFMATLLPATYVAVQEYQYQLIPLKFMITIINATNGTPLSPTFEMFLVLILFDVLNEASVRMPKYVGMALSIVGAIVLGETAVSAGLLSSPAVLIMAISAIGMYTTPNNIGTFSLIRLALLALASVLGICGIIAGVIVVTAHISNLKSFHTDYTAPYSPIVFNDLEDGFIKGGFPSSRPISIPNVNHTRKK